MQVNPGSLNGAQPTNYLINGVPPMEFRPASATWRTPTGMASTPFGSMCWR